MKRILSILLVILICFTFSVGVFANESSDRLYDGADLLTVSEENRLRARLDSLSEKYKVDIVIATVDTVGSSSVDRFVNSFYDSKDYGYGEGRDGVLLLVTMQERELRILSNGLGASAISDHDIESIGDMIAPSLTDGDYYTAFSDFIDECDYQLDGEINGFPFELGKNLLICLVIGFVVAFIATGVMKAQLKSVRKRFNANEYTKPGSMKVNNAFDLYLYSVVNRQKIEKSSSSGSSRGGSSRNVGGRSF